MFSSLSFPSMRSGYKSYLSGLKSADWRLTGWPGFESQESFLKTKEKELWHLHQSNTHYVGSSINSDAMSRGIYFPAPAHLCFSFLTSKLGLLGSGGLESDESFLTKGNICLILEQIHSQTVKVCTENRKKKTVRRSSSQNTTTMFHSLTSIFTIVTGQPFSLGFIWVFFRHFAIRWVLPAKRKQSLYQQNISF